MALSGSHWLLDDLDFGPSIMTELDAHSTIRLTGTTTPHIPNEIVIVILDFLSSATLFKVALVCRRFNYLALGIFISQFQLGDELIVYRNTNKDLVRALAMMLYPPPFKRIICQYSSVLRPITRSPQKYFHHELDVLRLVISKQPQLEEIVIDHRTIESLLCRRAKSTETIYSPEEWALCLIPLFTAAAEMSTILTIRFGLLYDLAPPKASAKWHGQEALTEPLTTLKHFLVDAIAKTRKMHSRVLSEDPRTLGLPTSSPAFKVFNVHSTMLFQSTLCSWTINTLNSSSVNRLSFDHIILGSDTWVKVLQDLSLPALVDVSFRACQIAFPDLIRFLRRHPHLTTLCLYETWSAQAGRTIAKFNSKQDFLSQLTTLSLSASHQHIPRFINIPRGFSSLRVLTIAISVPERELFPLLQTERLLSTIARRLQDITLTLKITVESCSPDWLVMEDTTSVPLLSLVQKIEITASLGRLEEEVWLTLPTWLGIFPALREVLFVDFKTFLHTKVVDIEQPTMIAFVKLLSKTCEWIDRVGFNEEVNGVDVWLSAE